VLGLELDDVGAVNSVKFANFGLATPGGADIVRNGGHAVVPQRRRDVLTRRRHPMRALT